MRRNVYFSTGLILFIALVLLWIPWLGETIFYSKGEPREAMVAMAMLQQGDWLLPVTTGTDMPFKPPFLAWLIAIFAKIFNGGVVNEFLSRLPSALAAIGLVMGTYGWARRIRGEQFALFMAMILATSVEFYRAAVACRVDMVLTAAMVGAMYILYTIRTRADRDNFWRYLLVVILLTVATLTKGPVGSLLPCLVMGLFFLWNGEDFLPTLGRLTAVCIASFIVPAVWYYFAWQRGGSDFLQLVWEENFQRLSHSMPYSSHVKPFWYNFITLILGMLPWTLLAVMSLGALKRIVTQPLKPAGKLALTAVVTVVVFYCIPISKRSVYLLPAYPFLAYGVASIAETLSETRINNAFTRVLCVIAIAVPLLLPLTRMFPVAGFSFEAVKWWHYILLALPVIVAIALLTRTSRKGPIGDACLVIWAMYIAYAAAIMPAVMNPLSDRPEARMLDALADGKPIYVVGMYGNWHYTNTYAINYYLDDRTRHLACAADADTCPTGTILLFPNLEDTVGVPPTYKLALLKERLSDTRRPALFAVQTGQPVVRQPITTAAAATDTSATVVAEPVAPAPKPTATPVQNTASTATRTSVTDETPIDESGKTVAEPMSIDIRAAAADSSGTNP